MIGRLTGQKKSSGTGNRELLRAELDEIEDISRKLFLRIEKKISEVKEAEDRLDRKISHLEKLLAEAGRIPSAPRSLGDETGRGREVAALAAKGLKVDDIAAILDMPKGEIELILGLQSR